MLSRLTFYACHETGRYREIYPVGVGRDTTPVGTGRDPIPVGVGRDPPPRRDLSLHGRPVPHPHTRMEY